ncbi:SAM-dependent methyltransferase [Actinoplanes sp. LDG1-06]|uniref:SAM-dependent methyltransferase n=1 Tax=Paractinoplanes ovalisporus TaxID=2810368 RepID=A0ABS2A7S0_9ACTN|nr:SAM-dependent methyltransferase [Actinoplanes ovalisporus]MBM2615882.1 SAM-dependent methyltransferase [Actinoplanes ovalisporus]
MDEQPQTARIWNYWLGGKDNFAVDRAVGDQIREAFPDIVDNARASRAFLVRAVGLAAGEGIRQFLDVGTGLPTADNTHEVAQRAAPEARIVYVDFDPLVLTHARALLTSSPEGATAYIDADGRDTVRVLTAAADTLDLSRPVALIMSGLLGHVTDDDEALTMVRAYLAALAPGSWFIALDGSHSIEHGEAEKIWNDQANPPYVLRSHAQFARFFEGLTMVEPGVTSAPLWRPAETNPKRLDVVCGVAIK